MATGSSMAYWARNGHFISNIYGQREIAARTEMHVARAYGGRRSLPLPVFRVGRSMEIACQNRRRIDASSEPIGRCGAASRPCGHASRRPRLRVASRRRVTDEQPARTDPPSRRDHADDGADLPLPDDDHLGRQPLDPRRRRRRSGSPPPGSTRGASAATTSSGSGPTARPRARTGRRRSSPSTGRSTTARPDLRGIVHAHPVALVAFSICRQVPDTRLLHQARQICGAVGFAPYALPGQRGARAEHRRDLRRGVRLRRAREPRRRDRRGEPPAGLRAVRDAGVRRQDGDQGEPPRRRSAT